jgi:hypothetical protein
MKKIVLLCLLVSAQKVFSQQSATAFNSESNNYAKSVVIKEKFGADVDPKTRKALNEFRLIFAVDTATNQLLNVVRIDKKHKEVTTIFYYNGNDLAQVITGSKENASTSTDKLYWYTKEDNQMTIADVATLSETSEKYDLLLAGRAYMERYQKEDK